MLLLASRGNLLQAAEMAKVYAKDDPRVETVLRAAVSAGTTTDATWAGNLVQYNDIASEFIDLLRPMTILGRMNGFRTVPFNVRIPRQTAGATANWVGQGKPKPMSSLAFDTITLQWSKIAVIVALTDELVRFSNPSAVALCQADLISTISQFMDEQFIDPDVAASANVSPASILNGVTATPSTGSTVSAITTDIKTILGRFDTANQPLNNPYWIMNPRTLRYLQLLRTSQDVWAWPETREGMLQGIPVVTSNSVSLDYGSPSATYIALVNAGEILVADDGQVMLDVSREASLQFSDAPSDGAQSLVSLWQNNLVGLRAERYINWLKRRSSAAYFIDGVTY
jgi:HK97 family phage major capsid protein